MKRFLLAFTLAISLVCGTLGAQTPAVQRSARTTMYVGVVPAELAQAEVDLHAKPSEHTTQTPNVRGRHHVVVALFDTRTGRRITDAKVTATLCAAIRRALPQTARADAGMRRNELRKRLRHQRATRAPFRD